METPWRVELAGVTIGVEERDAVDEVLRSGWLSMGPRTQEFEERFAAFVGGKNALAVANGTAALHLAALGLGVGPGDEVICPALTFVASAAAMRHAGADVILADSVSLDDFSIDPAEIGRLITPRTKAVVVVHYGGHPIDVAAIRKQTEAHGLLMIEDAAHALGATFDDESCGTLGDAGCFSFFPNKNMTTGEGGMVVARDDEAAERMRRLRSHAMTTLTWDRHRGHASTYDVVGVGFNYRIDEIRSALGIAQLARLPELNARRAELVLRYRERLEGTEAVIPSFGGRGTSANHLLVVVVADRDARDGVRERLQQARIQSSIHYPAIHRFAAYSGGQPLAVAESIAARAVTLPLHPGLSEADVDLVCDEVLAALA
jgi:dTDP-4-amino-4,6-dideoxygalactose transaminase